MKFELEISSRRIADMVIAAFEGGSNYWCLAAEIRDQNGAAMSDIELDDNPDRLYLLRVKHDGTPPERWRWERITLEGIAAGLVVMATKYPKHFADLIQENDDADTADCFLQCCAFGEMVYG